MSNKKDPANVIGFPKALSKAKKVNDEKFSKPVMDCGYTMVPAILIRAQRRIGLSPIQFAILIHLLDYWWYKDQPARPSQTSLAERLGISVRQLQRHLKDLETAELIRVERRHHAGHNGNQPNFYHLDGLVKKLKELEPEFTEQREAKLGLEKPTHLRKKLRRRRKS